MNDLERSLAFFQDCVGLKVFFDDEIAGEVVANFFGIPGSSGRMVILQSGDSVTGMVGLLSFLNPERRPRQVIREAQSSPDILLLFLSDSIQATYEKVKADGFDITCPP